MGRQAIGFVGVGQRGSLFLFLFTKSFVLTSINGHDTGVPYQSNR